MRRRVTTRDEWATCSVTIWRVVSTECGNYLKKVSVHVEACGDWCETRVARRQEGCEHVECAVRTARICVGLKKHLH